MKVNKCIGCDCQEYEKCGRKRECACSASQVCVVCFDMPVKDTSAAYKKLLGNLSEYYGSGGEE